MIHIAISNGSLNRMRITIGVTQLEYKTTGNLILLPKFKSNTLGHTRKFSKKNIDINTVLLKCIFNGDRLLFLVRRYRRFIDPIRASPKFIPGFADHITMALHRMDRSRTRSNRFQIVAGPPKVPGNSSLQSNVPREID